MQFFKSLKKMLGKGLFSPLKLLLLIVPIMILFSSSLRPLGGENRVVGFLQNLIYPVQYVFYQTGSSIIQRYQNYFESSAIAERNRTLEKNLIELETKLLDYNELKSEIEQLKKITRFSTEFDFKSLDVARVISASNKFLSSGLRVSSGTLNGVKQGMPVLSPVGLVGKVLRADYYFSDIQLVSDDNFFLDVFIERTRVRSFLRGGTRERCYLSMERKIDARIGDKIITSGMLNIFPKGIPVGEIANISYDARGERQIVEVKPIIQRNSLEKVVILKKLSEEREFIGESIKKAELEKSQKKK